MSTFNHNDKFFITSGGNVVINGQSTDGYFEIRQTDNTPSIRLNNGSNPNGAYYDILSNTAGSLVLNRNGSLLTTLSDTSGNATFGGTVRAEDRFDLYDGSYVFQLRNSSGVFDIRNGNSGDIPLEITSSTATFTGDVIAANRLLRIRNTLNDATGTNSVVNYLYFDATDDNDTNRSTGLIQTTSENAFSSSVLATIDSSMQFFVSENNFLVKWLDVASDKTATFSGDVTVTGEIKAGIAGNSSANTPALRVYASGATTDTKAAIAIQQGTTEGDTIIFADYEPHVEWGISAQNSTDQIHFTAGSSTNSLGTKTFYNNSGNSRTAYIKFNHDLTDGTTLIGGNLTAKSIIKSGGTSSQYLMADGSVSTGVASHNHDDRYYTETEIDAKFTSSNGSEDEWKFTLGDESNMSGNKWYKVATINQGAGGLHIKGSFSNHVESFGTQHIDLLLQGREGDNAAEIEINGTVNVVHNAGTGTDKVGIRVVEADNTTSQYYHYYDVYMRTTRYTQAKFHLTKFGTTAFHTSKPSVTTEPSPISGGSVELDTSTLDSGNHVIVDSEVKTTIADSTGYVGLGIDPTTNQRLNLAEADANGSHIKMTNSRSGGGYWVTGVGDSGSSSSITPAGGIFWYNGSTKMVIDSSGNVGIGVNAPASKLQISSNNHATDPGGKDYSGSAINADGGDISTGRIFFQGYQNGATDLSGINNEANRVVLYNYTDSRYLQIWDHDGTSSIPSGSFGIGEQSPTHALHVHSDTDNDYVARFEGSTNNGAGVWTGIGIGGEAANTKAAIIFEDIGVSYSRGKLHLAVNNDVNQNSATKTDAKLTVSNNGNVGIGQTSPPTNTRLSITGTNNYDLSSSSGMGGIKITGTTTGNGNYSSGIGFAFGSGTSGITGVQDTGDNDTMGLAFFTHPSSTGSAAAEEKMRITSGGNVGIGTAGPSELLTLNKASGGVGILLEGNGTDVGKFKVSSAGVNHAVQFGTISNNEIQFHTANTEKMRITGGGEVYFDATGTTAAAIKDGAFLYRNDSSSYLQFVTGTNNDTTSLYLYRKNSSDNDVQIFGKIGNSGLGLTIGSGGNNNTLILDANENATFAGTIKPSQGMESVYGVYTDGGTYTNQWQKVLSIPYASNMFGYAGIVLSIMQIGATNGAGAHADIHIHFKFQSNNGRLNANIINYGETKIEDDHIAIHRDHSNLRIELYHKVTTSYTSPRYLLKHNTTTITWYNTVTGNDTALAATTDDGFTELNITNGFTSNVANGNVTLEGEVEIYKEGNDTTGKLTLAGNNNTGTPGQKTSGTIEHRGAHLKTVITHNGSDVITIGTGTDTAFAGNVTAGNSSTAVAIRAHHDDGAYVDHTGYGIQFARNASYLRPNNDGARTMYFGQSSLTWNAIVFDSNSYSFQRNGSEYMQINSSGEISVAPGYNGGVFAADGSGNVDTNWGLKVQKTASVDDYNVRLQFYPDGASATAARKLGFYDERNNAWLGYWDGSVNSNLNWIFNSGGNVGIGETSPDAKLHVVSTTTPQFKVEYDSARYVEIHHSAIFNVSGAGQSNDFHIGTRGNSGNNEIVFLTGGTTGANAGTERMRILSGGNVTMSTDGMRLRIGANSIGAGLRFGADNDNNSILYASNAFIFSTYQGNGYQWKHSGTEKMRFETDGDLHVDGDVIAYSTTVSDKALKDDVITIDSALDKVIKLRGVEYTWNATSRKGQKDIGVIAQEVEEVIPEIVREKKMSLVDGEKYKTVDYEKLTAVLIEAVKELKEEVEELKNNCNGSTK